VAHRATLIRLIGAVPARTVTQCSSGSLRDPRCAGPGRHLLGACRAAQPALVDGAAGAVWAPGGRPRIVFGFTITGGKIVPIDLLLDPERLRELDLTVLDD
jgi:hypothetical protein